MRDAKFKLMRIMLEADSWYKRTGDERFLDNFALAALGVEELCRLESAL